MKILKRRFLPTKTKAVHAASIEFFNDHPVFSWFGGTREGGGDVRVFIYNLNGDGETITIGSEDNIPRWNPVLFAFKDKLLLFEKAGMFCDRWQTFVHDISKWSNDISEKEIRETAQILAAGLNGPVKTKPIVVQDKFSNDEFLCGSSIETMYDWSSYIEQYRIFSGKVTLTERSWPLSVAKKTYTDISGTKKTLGIIQPTLWRDLENPNGPNGINAFFRASSGLEKIYVARSSTDINSGRRIWTTPVPTNLLNPNSGIDTVVYKDKLYLVYNPSQDKREPLVISRIEEDSKDNSFFHEEETLVIKERVIEESPFISRELSYPYMIEHKGLFYLVYTYGRVGIELVVIEP